jgi:endo-1,4-beta-xylanase
MSSKNFVIQFLLKRITRFAWVSVFGCVILFNSCSGTANTSKDPNDTIPSLCEVYEDFFPIGVSVAMKTLNDSMDRTMILKHFNSITSENYMKWEFIHPQPGIYDFAAADSFVEFGQNNNMYIVGHVLVWHSQTPKWVFQDEEGNKASPELLLQRMKEHISNVVGRYRGKVHAWDVVNEAVGDDGKIRKNIWYDILGEEYVYKAFEFARDADPDAELIYNDYSVPTPVKRDGIVRLVENIQNSGSDIDAVGLQAHYHLDYPTLEDLDDCLQAFADLGLNVAITELDINVLPNPKGRVGADVRLSYEFQEKYNPYTEGLPDSIQTLLADRYKNFFEVFLKYRDNVSRVTLWGIQDGQSWKNNWPIRGRTNYPLLFDRQYQPKKAFWELVNLAEEN